MRKLHTMWFGCAALMVLGLQACTVDQKNEGTFQLNWSLAYLAGAPGLTCADVGATTVSISAQKVGGTAQVSNSFPCMTGWVANDQSFANLVTSPVLPAGNYVLTASLRDANGIELSSATGVTITVFRNQATDAGNIGFEVQSFLASWAIVRGPVGAEVPITCAQAGATSVELETQQGTNQPLVYSFDCLAGSGETLAVLPGAYNLTLRLMNGAGQVLSTTGAMPFTASNSVRAMLPQVTFKVN